MVKGEDGQHRPCEDILETGSEGSMFFRDRGGVAGVEPVDWLPAWGLDPRPRPRPRKGVELFFTGQTSPGALTVIEEDQRQKLVVRTRVLGKVKIKRGPTKRRRATPPTGNPAGAPLEAGGGRAGHAVLCAVAAGLRTPDPGGTRTWVGDRERRGR